MILYSRKYSMLYVCKETNLQNSKFKWKLKLWKIVGNALTSNKTKEDNNLEQIIK
jgi:hypothetical protein